MKKQIIFYFVSLVLVSCLAARQIDFAQYTEGNRCRSANILIQGAETDLSASSFILAGEIMIPVIEFLDKIGVHSTWNSNTDQLIVYDNNIFLKLMQNDFFIRVNGQDIPIPVPAVLYKGGLYAPAGSLLDALEIEYEADRKLLDVKYRETQGDISVFDRVSYRRYSLIQEGMNLYIPLDFVYNNGVFINEPRNQKISIFSKNDWVNESRFTEEIVNRYEKYISKDNRLFYVSMDDNLVIQFDRVVEKIADRVVLSITKDVPLPNIKLEHYFEFADFHERNVSLEKKIYSNMIGEGFVDFSGKIESSGRFRIKVQKDPEKYEYYIPIEDGRFSGKIYLPFGTGKHNISIALLSEGAAEKDVMIFSAINILDTIQKDIVPTIYMDFENTQTQDIISKVKYTATNQKQSAELMYRWILEHYKIDKERNTTRKLSELMTSHGEISEQEACILYAGMLRYAGIPAKIARKRSSRHYWVVAYLNGEWKQMGIVSDLKNGSFLHFYRKQYDVNTEYLEY